MSRPTRLRASDAERAAAVARLQQATVEGRLTLDEFSRRTDQAYAARTWVELDDLLADLPVPRAVGSASARVAGARGVLPVVALLVGVVSIPVGFLAVWGPLLGLAGVLLGVFALRRDGGRTAVAGICCSLVAPAFYLALPLFLDIALG